MVFDYDTIVIGGGPGGLATAYALNSKQHVLVVEGNLWGGTCPNFGCDPKKMLYGVVEAKRQGLRYQDSGLKTAAQIDWPKLMAFKKTYTDKVPTGTAAGLESAGINHLSETAHFVDAHTLLVGTKTVTGNKIVIATGATPTIPDITGSELYQTSTDFLSLPKLPNKIGFVGGGYVAIELANIAVEAGAEVYVFQHNDRLLRGFPENETQRLRHILAEKGIHFHMNTAVTALQQTETGQVRVATDGDASFTLDAIFAAAGRRPNIDQLDLSKAGVKAEKGGILVDDHLKTTADNIYAIGDVIAKQAPKLTPVSGIEGRYVASTLLAETVEPIHYAPIPHTVFAGPELAQVGVTLTQAEQSPERYTVRHQAVGSWYTYHRLQDQDAQVTTIQDKQSGLLVGAVVLAINAEELINDLTQLITAKTPADEIKNWVPIYPSVASDLGYFYY